MNSLKKAKNMKKPVKGTTMPDGVEENEKKPLMRLRRQKKISKIFRSCTTNEITSLGHLKRILKNTTMT